MTSGSTVISEKLRVHSELIIVSCDCQPMEFSIEGRCPREASIWCANFGLTSGAAVKQRSRDSPVSPVSLPVACVIARIGRRKYVRSPTRTSTRGPW